MLSRLKSSVKGVVRSLRGAPAPEVVSPAPVVARPAPAPAPVRTAPPVVAAPVVAAPVVAAPVVAAPAAEPAKAAKVNGTKTKVEPAKAAEPAAVAAPPVAEAPTPEVVPEVPKKMTMAQMAAAAASNKAPAPAPVAASDDDDHDDHGHGDHGKKSTSLAAAAAAASGGTMGRMVRADMGSTDRAAYIARAIANNRDPKTIKGGEGRNVAEDGVAYMGPLDNESSRAKAAAQVITVDQFECISCGTCVEQTNRVFYLPVDGKATPIAQDGPMDLIQDAIEACPVTCIHWVTPVEAEEKGYATGIGEDWTEVIQSLPVD